MSGRLSEALAVVSCIDADANAAGTFWGDAVSMGTFHKVMYVLSVGDMAASSTVDYSVYGCATIDGTYAAFTTAKAATQLTQAGTDADKQVVIEVDAVECQVDSYIYVKDRLLVGTDAVDACAIGLGAFAKYELATDLSSVDEIID
jgi:hypothetical protein